MHQSEARPVHKSAPPPPIQRTTTASVEATDVSSDTDHDDVDMSLPPLTRVIETTRICPAFAATRTPARHCNRCKPPVDPFFHVSAARELHYLLLT